MNDEKDFTGGFHTLEAWKAARDFRIEISKLVKLLPQEEKFRLCDQLIRASRSITANIAEGYGRFHDKERIKYCYQARGSLMEVLDHLITARDDRYIENQTLIRFKDKYDHVLKLLNGYIKFLQNRSKNPPPQLP